MKTKNIQDVVAEKVEEFRSVSQKKVGDGYIGDLPYTDYEYYFTQEQIDWLTTTLTQLVKEVEAEAHQAGIDEAVEKLRKLPYGTNGDGQQWIMKKDLDNLIKAL